jgi:hypothetical protein
LDLLKNYVIYETDNNRTIKKLATSEKAMSIAIYDILSENNNKYPEEKVNELTIKIIELAKRDL